MLPALALLRRRALTLCALGLLFCLTPASRPAVTLPVVAWFDDYNQVLHGTATFHEFIRGGSVDLRNVAGTVRCIGPADLRLVPPSADPPNQCGGVRGEMHLSCSDGRQLVAEWEAEESCWSGGGRGLDQQGNSFRFVYGGTRARARNVAVRAVRGQAWKPTLPPYDDPTGVPHSAATTGSGFFVTRSGHLITNHHVVQNARKIQVYLDGDLVDAVLVGIDETNDLALLQVDAVRPPLSLRVQHPLAKGEEVLTIGYPLVSLQGREPKATFGRVNALSGPAGDERFAQIDVPIQPGNSGGPLLDTQGRVVGIVTSMLAPAASLKLAGALPQNVNYALKSEHLYDLLLQNLSEGWHIQNLPPARQSFTDLVSRAEASVVLVIAWSVVEEPFGAAAVTGPPKHRPGRPAVGTGAR